MTKFGEKKKKKKKKGEEKKNRDGVTLLMSYL